MKNNKHKKLYICNRKKCKNCSGRCLHTSDIKYAKYKQHNNFDFINGNEWERGEMPHEHISFKEEEK